MRIIIVGAGAVGTQLALYLIEEGNEVSVIEQNPDRAKHASNRIDCLVVNGDAKKIDILEEAGIARANVLVCVTDCDETNMIVCTIVASIYPLVQKISQVRKDVYGGLGDRGKNPIGIDHFIYPDVEIASSVIDAIDRGALGDILDFKDNPYEMGAFDVTASCTFNGMPVRDFRMRVKGDCLVILIERDGKSIMPDGSTLIMAGDRLNVMATKQDLPGIFEAAGRNIKPFKKIGIVGGGRVASLVIENLLGKDSQLKKKPGFFSRLFRSQSIRRLVLIEKNYELCKDLAARYPDVLVLNEDISDEGFISEEGIDDLDLVVTTTSDQELNMIASLYLKSRGVRKAVAIVSGSGYAAIARQLGIDVVVPTRSAIVDSILSRIVGSGIRSIHHIGDGSIEILEIVITGNSQAVGKALSEMKFGKSCLVLLVERNGNSFIPRGEYNFAPGDRIFLITGKSGKKMIKRMLGGKA